MRRELYAALHSLLTYDGVLSSVVVNDGNVAPDNIENLAKPTFVHSPIPFN